MLSALSGHLLQRLHARSPRTYRLLRGLWWRLRRRQPPPDTLPPEATHDHAVYLQRCAALTSPSTPADAGAAFELVTEGVDLALLLAGSPSRCFGFLPAGDRLAPGAQDRIAAVLHARPDCALLYTDTHDADSGRLQAHPAFDPVLWRGGEIPGFRVVSRTLLGEFLARAGRALDLPGYVACHVEPHRILHLPLPLHERRGAALRVDLPPNDAQPKRCSLSVIVPTRDGLPHLRACVESLLATFAQTPVDCELLLVDNGSVQPVTLDYLKGLRWRPGVRVLRYDAPFNYSAINNWAVRHANGELLLLLNDDVEARDTAWLARMIATLQTWDAGAVGARLLYPDGTLQHAGVVAGLGGVAGHPGRGLRLDNPALRILPLDRTRSVAAVTGACLLTPARTFRELGGLDEAQLSVAFNDVDYCLRLWASGRRVIHDPGATLIHYESVTRGAEDSLAKQRRFASEIRTMQQRWPDWLARDPYYSPHLSVKLADLSFRLPPSPDAMRGRAGCGPAPGAVPC